jgi:nucleotide-binding universal stress UspA family protein
MMHVIEGMPDLAHWKQPNPAIVGYLRDSEERALARLRDVVPREARTWCHPEELLTTGKPYQEILRIARERDVHLIVIGVHGRNPIDLMFFGSTTYQVVRAATCPVLTLRG